MTPLTNEQLIQIFLSPGIASTRVYKKAEEALVKRIFWVEDNNATQNEKINTVDNVTFTGVGYTPDCKCKVPTTWRVFKEGNPLEICFDDNDMLRFGGWCNNINTPEKTNNLLRLWLKTFSK